ncbi:hypothetical protein H5410_005417, partial [Solanum commersonii]
MNEVEACIRCCVTRKYHQNLTNSCVQRMQVAEMGMLRWMYGHTRSDKIGNEDIQNKVGVTSTVDKLREGRLKLFRPLTKDMTLDKEVRRSRIRVE